MSQPHPHWTHFLSLPKVQIMHTILCFEAQEVRSPELQTVLDLDLKRRSCSHLKTNAQSISGNFAAAPPFRRVFCSCKTTLWHTSATLQHPYAHFATAKWAVKIALLREIHPPLRKCSKLKKWAVKFPFCCQMISKLPNGCEMNSKLQNGYENAPGFKVGC